MRPINKLGKTEPTMDDSLLLDITICFYVLFLTVFSTHNVFAYDLPMGIPDPEPYWEGTQSPLDDPPPARPSPWSSEVPGYYYVNNETGTDSARPYGTPSAPRATIPTTLGAGSYVEVHGN